MNKKALKEYLDKMSDTSAESNVAFKKIVELLETPEKWECEGNYSVISTGLSQSLRMVNKLNEVKVKKDLKNYGNLFPTLEIAQVVSKERAKYQKIQAWVAAEQGDFSGEFGVYEDIQNHWRKFRDPTHVIGSITMREETAEKLADLLNKGLI